LFCGGCGRPSHPLSPPTRRSSDLERITRLENRVGRRRGGKRGHAHSERSILCPNFQVPPADARTADRSAARQRRGHLRAELESRSEEHTSELQSRVELVCRLLLED